MTKVNKFVRTKMRPKEGTKIELQRDLSDFVRFVRFSGFDLSDLSDSPISAIKKTGDGRTDRRTDRPSYRDAWTHLKSWDDDNVKRKIIAGHSLLALAKGSLNVLKLVFL